MGWKDKLMLKMMSSTLIIKIFSIPIVVKLLTWMAQILMAIFSLFGKKKAEV